VDKVPAADIITDDHHNPCYKAAWISIWNRCVTGRDVVSVSMSRSRDGLETHQRIVSVLAIYVSYLSDGEISGRGLDVLHDRRFSARRPLARKMFTVPASSAASERVFSRAGLIMR